MTQYKAFKVKDVFSSPEILNSDVYQISLEVFNAVSHGIGFVLSILATCFLFMKGVKSQSLMSIVAYLIFALSMCLMYFNSMMYHAMSRTILKPIFKFFDHTAIYLLIAGSYTPFALLLVGGWLGLVLVIVEWGVALIGIMGKAVGNEWIIKHSTLLYLLMGWMAIFAIRSILTKLPLPGIIWLFAGGLAYSLGTIFYKFDEKYAYFHVFWHFFVMLGSACLFVTVYCYV